MKKIGMFLVLLAAGTVCFAQDKAATTTGQASNTMQAAKPAPKAPLHPAKVVGEPKLTPGGVKYWDIVTGTGPAAQNGMKLKVYYTGWLTNGKKFDSSYDHPPVAPIEITLGVGGVIKGWDEGLVGMKVGGKRQLHIPPELAYGEKGAPGAIPPNSELIFDCRLVSARGAAAAPAAATGAASTTAKPAPKAPLQPAKVMGEPKLTPGGVKYWDIIAGTGPAAQKGMKIKVYYTGWLTNGTKFDSSYDHPPVAPIEITLGVGQVIKGWDEGLVGMRVGGKRQLHIPPEMAYGDKDRAPIPANSELIFDCKLVSAVAAAAAPAK